MRNLLGLLMALSASAARSEEPFPTYSAVEFARPPIIDGKLDDACWQAAERTAPFVAIGGGKVAFETRGMACWDRKNLYVALLCNEPMMDTLKQSIDAGRLSPFDESIEIFIDSNRNRFTYMQFRVGVQGETDTHLRSELAPELDAKWTGAASLEKDCWTVEASIPLKLLGGAQPSPNALWGFNLNRQRIIQVEGMWTCWSDTKGGFHSPGRFGQLLFAPYPVWLKAHTDSSIKEILSEAKDLMAQYPRLRASWSKSLDRLDKDREVLAHEVTSATSMTADQFGTCHARSESLIASYEEALAGLRLEVIRNEFR